MSHPFRANSVYDLPFTEQALKWMHVVYGYPVKSTWLKAVQAGNFVGWPLLTPHNVQKFYPETVKTPKGCLNQTRKNIRSTKPKAQPLGGFPVFTTPRPQEVQHLHQVYNTRDTTFTDQAGKFPLLPRQKSIHPGDGRH